MAATWLLCVFLDYRSTEPVCFPMISQAQCYLDLNDWLVRAADWADRSRIRPAYMAGCAPWAILPPYTDRNVMANR